MTADKTFVPGVGFAERVATTPEPEDSYEAKRARAQAEKIMASMDRKLGRVPRNLEDRKRMRKILGDGQSGRTENRYDVLRR